MLDADPVRELATMWLRHAGEDLHACRALVPIGRFAVEMRYPVADWNERTG